MITDKLMILLPLIILSISRIAMAETLIAENANIEPQYKEAFSNIEAILSQETEIATKTKLNADFVPGMVTVLRGDEMKQIGIRTVGEALTFVPNMPNETGVPFSVRGLSSSTLAGKIKTMIDGIPVNNNTLGGWGDGGKSPFFIPIELVERIEVIRGPGGTLYGKWAYLGVINVVTKKEENSVFARVGSFGMLHAGSLLSIKNDSESFAANFKISGWKNDDTKLVTGTDSLYGTPNEPISLAPGPVNDEQRFYSMILDMQYKDFSMEGIMTRLEKNSFFGLFSTTLPPWEDDITSKFDNRFLRADWKKNFEGKKVSITLDWRQFVDDPYENWLYPPGYAVYMNNVQVSPVYPGGWKIGPYIKEEVISGTFDLQWHPHIDHDVLLSAEYEKVIKADHYIRKNIDQFLNPLPSPQIFSGSLSWLTPDIERDVLSFLLQDQWDATDRITFTGGIRFDTYSDVGDQFTPRLSAVFRATENHIFKGQFAKGFRPPTFVELYFSNNPISQGNPNLIPEEVYTWEAGYTYRCQIFIGRLTLFHSDLVNLIQVDTNGLYQNNNSARTTGAEVDLDWKINSVLLAKGGLGYSDTKDDMTGEEVEGAVNWQGYGNLLFEAKNKAYLSLLYRYIGKTNRAHSDPREKLHEMNVVDLTAGKEDFVKKGVAIRTGIKNIFDEDIRTHAAYPGYVEDLPRPGRSWWVQAEYSF